MRVLATEVIDGVDREVRYVPENGSTVWLRVLDADGEVVSDVDTGEAAPEPEPVADSVDALLIAAEQARRDAYDAVIAAGTLTMARINAANRAGMDAYIAVLGG